MPWEPRTWLRFSPTERRSPKACRFGKAPGAAASLTGTRSKTKATLDKATDNWGIKVELVEIKDVKLPVQLHRAMAAEAEAAREARAKVIAAEGEMNASRALQKAAAIICENPAALQLRYLQTLTSIAAEKNSTIIFPLPLDILHSFISPKH